MNKDIKVIALNKSDLKQAIDQDRFWDNKTTAISKEKAIWLTQNDHLSENDPCIVIGIHNQTEIISYILIVPDLFQVQPGVYEKKFWFSDWWLNPEYRETGIAALVFFKACKVTGNQVFISAYSNSAGEFYERLGQFVELTPRTNHLLFFTFDQNLLLGKYPKFRLFKPGIHLINFFVNTIYRPINKLKLQKRVKTVQAAEVQKIDEHLWKFIESKSKGNFILKTKEHINWQIDNLPYMNSRGSALSSKSMKVLSNENLLGFISYIQSPTVFEVKFLLPNSAEELDICIDVLVREFLKTKCHYISTFDEALAIAISKRYNLVYMYKDKRKAIVHKSVIIDKNMNIVIRDSEGA